MGGDSTLGFAVVDCETTGLDAAKDRIIEIAVITLNCEGVEESRWSSLVNPQSTVGAQHVHGLSAADLAEAPTFAEIAPTLTRLLARRAFVSHNVVFDAQFVNAELARCASPFTVSEDVLVCTMELSKIYLPFGRHSLAAAAERAGIDARPTHRALADADVAARLLRVYLNREAQGIRYEQSAQTRSGGVVFPASWLRALSLAASGLTQGSLAGPANAKDAAAWTSSWTQSDESALA